MEIRVVCSRCRQPIGSDHYRRAPCDHCGASDHLVQIQQDPIDVKGSGHAAPIADLVPDVVSDSVNWIESGGSRYHDSPRRCIYCGSFDDLSDEHVVPKALGGRQVIRAASCPVCSAMTSRLELAALRGPLFEGRVAGGFPTRRPSSRPNTLPVEIVMDDDTVVSHDVARQLHPGIVVLPVFEPPWLLGGPLSGTGINLCGNERVILGNPDIETLIRSLGGKGIRGTSLQGVTDLPALVAKIAHCYAVAEMGLFPADESPLLPLIRGEATDFGRWIGSPPDPLLPADPGVLHVVSTRVERTIVGREAVVVRVRLFADKGCSGFDAVTRMASWADVPPAPSFVPPTSA